MPGRPAALDPAAAGAAPDTGELPLDEAAVRRQVRERCFAPSDAGRVGVELERLSIHLEDPTAPLSMAALETAVQDAGPLPGGSRVTFEPGGQIELSSAVHDDVDAACRAVELDSTTLDGTLARHGFGLCGQGFDPVRPPCNIHPHPRYAAMARYFGERNFGKGDEAGLLMMTKTASLQVNLDLGASPEEVSRRWRAAHLLGPVLAAIFANSPGLDALAGVRSVRAVIWDRLDPPRARAADRGGEPATDWADFVLAAPVMLLRQPGEALDAAPAGVTFLQWIEGGLSGAGPTLADLELHLTTLFPPVRPRGFLELRMLDTLDPPWWQVAVAVTAASVWSEEVATAVGTRLEAEGLPTPDWAAAAQGLSDPRMAAAANVLLDGAAEAVATCAPAQLDATLELRDRWTRRGRCPADDLMDAWSRGAAPLAVPGPNQARP